MEAVPAVMASTWECISCLDSSILFLRQACDAFKKEEDIFGFMTKILKELSKQLLCDKKKENKTGSKPTASVPNGGKVSKSSRAAWAAWTACILELIVPVRACWAEVCVKWMQVSIWTISFYCSKDHQFLHYLYLNRSYASITKGGMCPLCICPLVMCCLAWGMEPIWKLSGPPAPERMIAGNATEPVSTFPTLLNCCCKTVDLTKKIQI